MLNPGPDHYQRSVSLSGPNYMFHTHDVEGESQQPVNSISAHGQAAYNALKFNVQDRTNPRLSDDTNDFEIHHKPARDNPETGLQAERDDLHKDTHINIDDIFLPPERTQIQENVVDDNNEDGNNNDDYDDYIDNNGDDDDDMVIAPRISPKFRRNGAIPIALEDIDRDEEYEQYIDEDEEEDTDLNVRPLEVLTIPHKDDDFPIRGQEHHDQDEGYNYYDMEDDHKPSIGKMAHTKQKVIALQYIHNAQQTAIHPQSLLISSEPSLGRIYTCIFVVMFVFLFLLYRFIKKRKVVIRYYHR